MDEAVCSKCLGYLNFIFELVEEKPVGIAENEARYRRKCQLEVKQSLQIVQPPKIDSMGCSPINFFTRRKMK